MKFEENKQFTKDFLLETRKKVALEYYQELFGVGGGVIKMKTLQECEPKKNVPNGILRL